jgi:hypothetical protein
MAMKTLLLKAAAVGLALALGVLAPGCSLSGLKLRLGGDEGQEMRQNVETPEERSRSQFDYEVALTYDIPLEIFTPESAAGYED